MASIFPNGKYLYISYMQNGKRITDSLQPLRSGVKGDLKKAQIIKEEIEAKLLLDKQPAILKQIHYPTLTEAFNMWIDNLNLKKDTEDGYKIHFNTFLNFTGEQKLNKINRQLIKEYIKYLRDVPNPNDKNTLLSPTTIHGKINIIRMMFEYFVEEEIIESNPVPSNKILRVKKKKVDPEEIPSRVLDKIEDYLSNHSIDQYRFIRFLRLTALRKEDARKMTWDHIKWDQGYILHEINKTGMDQKLPLYPELKKFLATFEQKKGRLFPIYNSKHSFKFWNRALAKLEIDHYTIHQIRKTTLTELIYKGYDFETVHVFSGHSDPKTTWKHYRAVRNLIEANKLGENLTFRTDENEK